MALCEIGALPWPQGALANVFPVDPMWMEPDQARKAVSTRQREALKACSALGASRVLGIAPNSWRRLGGADQEASQGCWAWRLSHETEESWLVHSGFEKLGGVEPQSAKEALSAWEAWELLQCSREGEPAPRRLLKV